MCTYERLNNQSIHAFALIVVVASLAPQQATSLPTVLVPVPGYATSHCDSADKGIPSTRLADALSTYLLCDGAPLRRMHFTTCTEMHWFSVGKQQCSRQDCC
jgi:hypothetical protein